MRSHFQVELVWNREFHFVPYGQPHNDIDKAIAAANDIQYSGDGARVKKTRITDEGGNVVWAYGRMVKP